MKPTIMHVKRPPNSVEPATANSIAWTGRTDYQPRGSTPTRRIIPKWTDKSCMVFMALGNRSQPIEATSDWVRTAQQ